VSGYPQMITATGHVEPVPRRLRATVAGATVLDTTRALYVWEHPPYPQYYVPLADVRDGVLVPEGEPHRSPLGTAARHGLRVGELERAKAARVFTASELPGVAGCVRFEWSALDAWFEEDEQVFVHPRNPYVRVDALRALRPLRVELGGAVLADAPSCVMVFETGLPTRHYVERTTVDFTALRPSDTVTRCPYKGTTSGYWSSAADPAATDIAWAYDFPTAALRPIAGLVAFYAEKVDLVLDGAPLERPR
jgi:uncharacterized protein (DUF427 family)